VSESNGATDLSVVWPSLTELNPHVIDVGCYCPDMSKRRTLVACTAVILLSAIGSGSVSADESVPPSTTTVVEQFESESGLIWSKVDDNTIEVSLPD
jgi:hypothetical protein